MIASLVMGIIGALMFLKFKGLFLKSIGGGIAILAMGIFIESILPKRDTTDLSNTEAELRAYCANARAQNRMHGTGFPTACLRF
jgi:hypothetical protein